MTWIADLQTNAMVVRGDHVRTIGWLHPNHEFSVGVVPVEVAEKLRAFRRVASECFEALSFPAFAGAHECEFCNNDYESRNIGVPSGDILYVAPAMVSHYVDTHDYCPPDEFLLAVADCPLPDTPEYSLQCARFRAIHENQQTLLRQRMERGIDD